MKRNLFVTSVLCMFLLLVTACSSGGQDSAGSPAAPDSGSFTVVSSVDGMDYSMEFPEAPSRAVSLSGFTTEMMLALGLEDQMAGTAYKDNEILPEFKTAYESIPVLSDKYPSQEVLLNASPDFITGWSSAVSEKNFPVDFLSQNKIQFFIPRSEYPNAGIDEVYEDFRTLGKIFRVEAKAEEIIADMQREIGAVNDKVKGLNPVSVFLYDSGEDAPYTVGASLASDLIRFAGGENVFEKDGDYWMTVQWEAVVEKNPQWIVIMQYNVSDDVQAKIDTLKNNPALENIDAIKNNHIIVLGLSDVIAGVRNPGAVETMAKSFHPEAFEK